MWEVIQLPSLSGGPGLLMSPFLCISPRVLKTICWDWITAQLYLHSSGRKMILGQEIAFGNPSDLEGWSHGRAEAGGWERWGWVAWTCPQLIHLCRFRLKSRVEKKEPASGALIPQLSFLVSFLFFPLPSPLLPVLHVDLSSKFPNSGWPGFCWLKAINTKKKGGGEPKNTCWRCEFL